MTCFKLPDSLLDDIVSLLVGYWWGKKDDHKKIPWVAWSKMTRNKKDGGLGFRDLHCFNLALLAKQGWRLITQPHSLVAKILKAKYYPNNSFWEANMGTRPSFSWRSILGARKILELGCRCKKFSGNTTKTMSDPWLPRPSNFQVSEKIHVPPRVNHFLWHCCTNSLPTSTNLARRGVDVEDICPFCRAEDGTTLHFFFRFPLTIQVWHASGIYGHIYTFEQPIFELWIREIIIIASSTILDFVAMLLYGLWLARNKCIFEEASFLPHSIVVSASRILSDFKEARGWPKTPSPFLSDISFKIPRNCWRVYFDGDVFFRRNCIGAGVWIQSPENGLVMALCKRFEHCIDSEVAEFRALQLAVNAAIELHLDKFVVIRDALGVLQSFKDPNICSTSCLPILDQIQGSMPPNVSVTPCWIGRGSNLVSHELAYFAKNMDGFSCTWDVVPPFIVSPNAG